MTEHQILEASNDDPEALAFDGLTPEIVADDIRQILTHLQDGTRVDYYCVPAARAVQRYGAAVAECGYLYPKSL